MHKVKQEIIASAQGKSQRINENTVKNRYIFTDDFIGFDGHFPEAPILPAFIQMLIARTLVEELHGEGLNLATVKNAKFHIPIRPNQEIEVECNKRSTEAHLGCEVLLKIGEGLAASFVLSFAEKENAS